jgi:hypothetical protein
VVKPTIKTFLAVFVGFFLFSNVAFASNGVLNFISRQETQLSTQLASVFFSSLDFFSKLISPRPNSLSTTSLRSTKSSTTPTIQSKFFPSNASNFLTPASDFSNRVSDINNRLSALEHNFTMSLSQADIVNLVRESSGRTVPAQNVVINNFTNTSLVTPVISSPVITGNAIFDQVGIGSSTPTEALSLNGLFDLAPVSTPSITTDKLYNVGGTLYWNGSAVGGGGTGISSLGAAGQLQTGVAQVFATSSDTNIGLTITSASNTHTFTTNWLGTLAATRGGTGISNPSAAGILLGSYASGSYQQIATSSLGLLTTNVAEGSNLYYTPARIQSFIDASTTIPKTYSTNTFSANQTLNGGLTVGSLTGPLQAINGVVSASSTIVAAFGGTGISNPSAAGILLGSYAGGSYQQLATSSLGLSTSNVIEGSNLYYLDTRVQSFVHGSTTIPKTYTSNTFTGGQTFSGSVTIGTLNGPLDVRNGVVGATTTVGVLYGGTGWSALQANTILLGNGTGKIATTSAGTDGQILALVSGVPTWQSTTTLSNISGTISNVKGGTGIDSSALTGVATINSGTWSASSTLAATVGGTGWGNIQSNAVVLGNGTQRLATTSAGTNGQVLALVSGVPTWQSTTTLTTISGTLGVSQGGTNITSPTAAFVLLGSYAGGAYQQLATSSLGLLTTNVAEGSNLYYLDTRVQSFVHASTTIPKTYTANNFTSTLALGSTTPFGVLTVNPTGGQASNEFVVGSSSATAFIINNNGNVGIGGTTTAVQVLSVIGNGYLTSGLGIGIATTSAGVIQSTGNIYSAGLALFTGAGTSTFGGGIQGTYLNLTGVTATSTATDGFNITNGCYAIATTCVGNVTSGTAGQVTFYSNTGQAVSGASNLTWDNTNIKLALSSSTPFATLSVNPVSGGASNQFVVGSSSATSFIINNNGNVGVGTTSPAGLLSVAGSAYLGNNSASTLTFNAGTINYPLQSTTTVSLNFNAWSLASSTSSGGNPAFDVSFSSTGGGATSTIGFFVATTTGLTSGGNANALPSALQNYIIVGNGKVQAGMAIVNGGLCVDNDGWCSATTTGRISSVSSTNSGSDLAEMYLSNEKLEPGDVVAISSPVNMLELANSSLSNTKTLGIIATDPGIILGLKPGDDHGGNEYPVSLAGRIPTKVSTENGPINPGDFITLSSVPGVAMKATNSGNVLGQALESYSGSGIGKISVFVKNTYFAGSLPDTVSGLSFTTLEDNEKFLTTLNNQQQKNQPSKIVADEIFANKSLLAPSISTLKLTATLTSLTGSTTISGNLTVDANTTFTGSVHIDHLSLGSLDWPQLASLLARTDALEKNFNDLGTQLKNLIGQPYSITDTGGTALIRQNASSVDVVFDREFIESPIVSAIISYDQANPNTESSKNSLFGNAVQYIVTNRSTKGFTLVINKPAPTDISFNWTALAIKNSKLFTSIDPVITPTTPTVPLLPSLPANTSTSTLEASSTIPVVATSTDPVVSSNISTTTTTVATTTLETPLPTPEIIAPAEDTTSTSTSN